MTCGDSDIDRPISRPYIRVMTVFRRLLFIAVLAAYVAGVGIYAASSTAMAGNMVLGGPGEMGDCQGCDPGGGADPASACDVPCLPPLMATLSPDTALPAPPSEQSIGGASHSFAGRTGPPDLSPPKFSILS